MILLLTLLRWIAIGLWIAIVWRLFPSARRSMGHARRTLDPVWAVMWGLALNRIIFVTRDIYYHPTPGPIETGMLAVTYMMAIVLAGGILKLRGWYGD